MTKNNPWFKFYPDTWLAGTVSFLTDEDQIFFLFLCCLIWKSNGSLPIDDRLHMRCSRYADACDRIDRLVKSGILQEKDNVLSVLFLSEQLHDINSKSKQAKNAANVRWGNEDNPGDSLGPACGRIQSASPSALPKEEERDIEKEKEAEGEREEQDPDNQHYQIILKSIQPYIDEFAELPDEEFLRFCRYWSGIDTQTQKRMYMKTKSFNARSHLEVWVINWKKDPDFWLTTRNQADDLFDKAINKYNKNEDN